MWRYGHVTVKSSTEFQMVVEGVVGSSHLGDAALDDIEISNGECYPESSCDFEEGLCGYYNTKEGDEIDWEKGSGPEYSLTGPTVDHTTSTQSGSYMFINPSYTHTLDDRAWLVSEVLSITDSSACLNWYMHLYGKSIGSLSIYQRIADQKPVKIWSTQGQRGDFWVLSQVTVQPQTKYFDFIFEATKGDGIFGNIAIDDINLVKGGSCEFFNSTTTQSTSTVKLPPYGLQCDFENNKFCEWFPDPASDKQWIIQNGNSAVYGTAPLNDVTTSSSQGKYAYVNTNTNINYGQAILRSPSTNYNQETCLEFWYQLNGPINSALTVVLRNKVNMTELWKRKGNQADSWSHNYVRVPNNNNGNQWLEFEGDVSNINSGYIALDEIRLIFDKCPTSQYCDFESPDICNYQQDITADFKWTRQNKDTATSGTGPTYDHTYQTAEGYYMYIEASYPQYPGQKARLISDKIAKNPGGVCLNFWYHAYGASIGTLNVYTRIRDKLSANPVWTISGNQGDLWRTSSVTVASNEDFQVYFSISNFEGILFPSFPSRQSNTESGSGVVGNAEQSPEYKYKSSIAIFPAELPKMTSIESSKL